MPHCMVLIRMAYKIRANSLQNSCLCTTECAFRKWYVINGREAGRSIRRNSVSVSQCPPALSQELGWEAGDCGVVLRHRGNLVTLPASRNTQLRAISRHRLPCWDCMEPILHSLMRPHILLLNSSNRPSLSIQGLLGGYGRGIDRRLLSEITAVIFKCRSLFPREFCTWNLK